jgi:hypothetical protein
MECKGCSTPSFKGRIFGSRKEMEEGGNKVRTRECGGVKTKIMGAGELLGAASRYLSPKRASFGSKTEAPQLGPTSLESPWGPS